MLWLLPTVAIALQLTLSYGIDNALFLSSLRGLDLRTEDIKMWHDCMCEEDNIHCVLSIGNDRWVRGVQGHTNEFQHSKTIFYDCEFHLKYYQITTCIRKSHHKVGCKNCHTVCLRNSSSCDVLANLSFDIPVYMRATDINIDPALCHKN